MLQTSSLTYKMTKNRCQKAKKRHKTDIKWLKTNTKQPGRDTKQPTNGQKTLSGSCVWGCGVVLCSEAGAGSPAVGSWYSPWSLHGSGERRLDTHSHIHYSSAHSLVHSLAFSPSVSLSFRRSLTWTAPGRIQKEESFYSNLVLTWTCPNTQGAQTEFIHFIRYVSPSHYYNV